MSAEKQNDSVTHTHIQSCKNTLLHYGLSQEIGFSSLCYTVGPCLTILNVIVCFYLSACVLSQVPLFANSMGCNLPGSSVHGIFQARILEGIIIFSSRGSSQLRDGTQVPCVFCSGRQIFYHLGSPPQTPGQPLPSTPPSWEP